MWHEQMRSDRDDYIRVNYDNLHARYSAQFKKVPTHNLVQYNYGSVMHYSAKVYNLYHVTRCFIPTTRAERVVLFSVVSVCVFECLSVCLLSVNTITPEPLDSEPLLFAMSLSLTLRNFQGIILWSKGRTSLKWLYRRARVVI